MDGGAWWAAVHGVAEGRTRLSNFTFTFHFHALEKEMATHSSVPAWRIPGTGEPGGLPFMGSQSWTRLKWRSSSSTFCQLWSYNHLSYNKVNFEIPVLDAATCTKIDTPKRVFWKTEGLQKGETGVLRAVCLLSGEVLLIQFFCFWLCWVFVAAPRLAFVTSGGYSSCGVQAWHCGGSSCCRARALGHVGFRSCGNWAQ